MSDVVRVLEGVTHMYTVMCIHSNSPFRVRIRIHIRDRNSQTHLLFSDSYSYSKLEFEFELGTLMQKAHFTPSPAVSVANRPPIT
jgi:hypothetical protein